MGEAPQRAAKPAKAARRKKRAAEECLVFECLKPRYDAFKKVGNGSYGVVCSAVDAQDAGARRVAIKRVSPWADDCWDARHTLRELRLMHLLRGHPNVISLHDAVLRPGGSDDLFIVMELMDSDLHRVVSSKQARGPRRGSRHTGPARGRRGGGAVDARRRAGPDGRALVHAGQILLGVQALHSVGILHRDLKPGNVLVSRDCRVRITDFGLSRCVAGLAADAARGRRRRRQEPADRVRRALVPLPRGVLAPHLPYSTAVDCWSAGCILGEMLLRPLFKGKNFVHQVQVILESSARRRTARRLRAARGRRALPGQAAGARRPRRRRAAPRRDAPPAGAGAALPPVQPRGAVHGRGRAPDPSTTRPSCRRRRDPTSTPPPRAGRRRRRSATLRASRGSVPTTERSGTTLAELKAEVKDQIAAARAKTRPGRRRGRTPGARRARARPPRAAGERPLAPRPAAAIRARSRRGARARAASRRTWPRGRSRAAGRPVAAPRWRRSATSLEHGAPRARPRPRSAARRRRPRARARGPARARRPAADPSGRPQATPRGRRGWSAAPPDADAARSRGRAPARAASARPRRARAPFRAAVPAPPRQHPGRVRPHGTPRGGRARRRARGGACRAPRRARAQLRSPTSPRGRLARLRRLLSRLRSVSAGAVVASAL